MFFPYRPFPEKNSDKIYEKNSKIPFLGHFGPIFRLFPQNKNFAKYGIYPGKPKTLFSFHLNHFQKKIMTKFMKK